MNKYITLDYSRDDLLTPQAAELLREYYMQPHEVSPQDAFARASLAFCAGDLGLAQRIYDAVSQLHFMFASPILSNAPAVRITKTGKVYFKKANGLPISCFLAFVPDTVEGLIEHQKELAWLSVKGGGVGGHWDKVRPVSKKAPGTVPFLKVADSGMLAWKQGTTRKGSYAGYMSVRHPDIIEFLQLRVPTGGDVNRKTLNIHHAVNIPNDFMRAVLAGEDWELRCPHTNEVRDTIKARTLWERLLETRCRTGEPFLNFIDHANDGLNPAQKAAGLRIHGSNLCNEIHLVTSEKRTAVCCLSSLNAEKEAEWAPTLVADLTRYLDNVLQYFIDKAPRVLWRAVASAKAERSLGIGLMGKHSYLQKQGVAFESEAAVMFIEALTYRIQQEALAESRKLAAERGEPSDLKGTGYRNAHLLAIAPNANSSIIAGTSPSIEPWRSNYFVHRTRIGSHVIKNEYLQAELSALGLDVPEVWASILEHEGSVQHLDLPLSTKRLFKTFGEMDMHWVVKHAAARQRHICQGQSINLFFTSGCERSYVNSAHLSAWKEGLKGLYYFRTTTGHAAEKVSTKVARVAIGEAPAEEECTACHA